MISKTLTSVHTVISFMCLIYIAHLRIYIEKHLQPSSFQVLIIDLSSTSLARNIWISGHMRQLSGNNARTDDHSEYNMIHVHDDGGF